MSSEATALMQRGIEMLTTGSPESAAEALACFERAVGLRRSLFVPGDHEGAYLLATSWMSRGDALTRLGGPDRLAEAVRSYDEALAVLRHAPADLDPLYRRHHALAWMNRGLILQEQGTAASADASIISFEQAIAATHDRPEYALLLAGGSINHAMALLGVHPPRAAEARGAAARALQAVQNAADQNPFAAEIHLKAQVLLCRAAETSLTSHPGPDESRELLSAATDAVEAGLALARRWEERGETSLGPLPTILFRFGLDLYRRRQPQFLSEFVRENLQTSVSPEWHRLAEETLAAETLAAGQESFDFLNTPRHQLLTETIQTLQWTRQRLQGLDRPA